MKTPSNPIEPLKKFCEISSKKAVLADIDNALIREALLIRLVEEKFLELFSAGLMNGTVHTCVGQEFSATAIVGGLTDDDWVTSNHRCHGHFISKTKNWQGLVDELMGLASGVCKGVGSSQHLYAKGFLSNGPQGALLPVATGIALNKKIKKQPGIAVSFIGEGTLGEGVFYEALNLASLYRVPQLFVCENNFYSQSTPQSQGVAGDVISRAQAFGIKCFEVDTWDVCALKQTADQALAYVREGGVPAFLLVRTYRLNSHSKGDDNRDAAEVEWFRSKDVLSQLLQTEYWQGVQKSIQRDIDEHIKSADKTVLRLDQYTKNQFIESRSATVIPVKNRKVRMIQALNEAYRSTLEKGSLHIGEDICDPYGGAFKVTKGLSSDFPETVLNAPISECGLVGIAIGSALMGAESFAEIMFGDFTTNIFDQLINNASKMHHMYAFQANVPVRVRTPMGGKRGYGPTHSQSLEKLLLGLDNVSVVALTSLCDPVPVINALEKRPHPVVVIENKVDYGRFLWEAPDFLSFSKESSELGSLRLSPKASTPSLTVVAYGETARQIADSYEQFFVDTDLLPEIICVTILHPIDLTLIEASVRATRRVLVVEDGSVSFGFGAEVISRLTERAIPMELALRIGAEEVPVPSVGVLEQEVLPTMKRIIRLVNEGKKRGPHA